MVSGSLLWLRYDYSRVDHHYFVLAFVQFSVSFGGTCVYPGTGFFFLQNIYLNLSWRNMKTLTKDRFIRDVNKRPWLILMAYSPGRPVTKSSPVTTSHHHDDQGPTCHNYHPTTSHHGASHNWVPLKWYSLTYNYQSPTLLLKCMFVWCCCFSIVLTVEETSKLVW